MSVFNNNLLLGAAGQGGAAEFDTTLIPNSVWLDGAADSLSKTFSSGSAQTKIVISMWVQRNSFGTAQDIFMAQGGDGGASRQNRIHFQADDTIDISLETTTVKTIIYSTTRVFRDVGWYHILLSIDQGETVGPAQVNLFVNGVAVTIAATVLDQGFTAALSSWGNAALHVVGSNAGTGIFYKGYQTQTTMLIGKSIQAGDVAVTDFLDSFTFGTNGSQFTPKANADIAALASTAGGNSFCLDYANSSDLGNDISSLGNDFSLNSMASANQRANTPSLVYPTMNPLNDVATVVLSEGNTRVNAQANASIRSTAFVADGKRYAEITVTAIGNSYLGVAVNGTNPTSFAATGAVACQQGGDIYVSSSSPSGNKCPAYTTNDVMGILIDVEANKFWVSKNGTFHSMDRNPTITLTASQVLAGTGGFVLTALGSDGSYGIHVGNSDGSAANVSVNFGQDDFEHTPPTGYLDWGSNNATAPEFQGADYFNAVVYEGTGSEQTIGSGESGSKFTALAWIKNRDAADDNIWMDRVIGTGGYLSTTQNDSGTAATAHGSGGSDVLTSEAQAVRTFGQRSVTIGTMNEVNTSGESYVLWQWLIGNSATSAGSITAGSPSLTTTGLIADTNHFSIVQYTGNATDGATFAHGLGATPDLVMVKRRSGAATNSDWTIHIVGLGTENYIYPHYRIAISVGTSTSGMIPGANLVEIGSGVALNKNSETHMAYCFKNMPGVFKVGTYTGNGSADGAYVSTGFKPKFVWLFNTTLTSADAERPIIDTARYKFNGTTAAGGTNGGVVFTDNRIAEEAMNTSLGVNPAIDILADGFKLRANDSTINTATTYLYICMADIGGNGTLPPIYGR